ncbi:spermidine/putrescine transport system permease protein [Rhizobium sp. RU20A]|uniref:ABC transporter permease n=1 Tax=Rhizobium sp. RU20A TaxID=1907412 RepID=UPI0009559526|nr:ABC transporter permease [Rhizobium sp. RU20A]SIQ98061.1 spermidine/putrescine transport system permease protein [Rhizobium sp. RU20A]
MAAASPGREPDQSPLHRTAPAPGGWRTGEAASGLALISPTLLYAAFLLLLPILIVFAYSFWTQDFLTIDHTFTLANYRAALTEPIYLDLLGRSLINALSVSVLAVLMAYPLAYFISFYGGASKNLWLFLITVPCWTSYLLRIMSWKIVLGYNGVLNSGLMRLGLIDKPIETLVYNSNAVIIALLHSWLAFAVLPIFVSLEKLDRSLIEAAHDLGDTAVQRFLRIILPLTLPGVTYAFLIVMIPTVGDYITPKLIGGSDGVMIATAIQAQFGKAANWPLGAALSITTMIAASLLAGLVVLVGRRLVRALA